MTGFLLSRIALCNSSIGRPTRPRPPYPSSLSEPLLRAELSPPEQKARSPAPASTMTPISGSLSASRIAASISSTVSARKAFSTFGRLIVIVATPSRLS